MAYNIFIKLAHYYVYNTLFIIIHKHQLKSKGDWDMISNILYHLCQNYSAQNLIVIYQIHTIYGIVELLKLLST